VPASWTYVILFGSHILLTVFFHSHEDKMVSIVVSSMDKVTGLLEHALKFNTPKEIF